MIYYSKIYNCAWCSAQCAEDSPFDADTITTISYEELRKLWKNEVTIECSGCGKEIVPE